MIKSLLFQNFSSNNSTTFDENLISPVKCKRAKDESLTTVVVFIVSYFYLFYFRSQLIKLKVGSILDPFSEESSYKTATLDAKLRDLWDVFVFYNEFFFETLEKKKKDGKFISPNATAIQQNSKFHFLTKGIHIPYSEVSRLV